MKGNPYNSMKVLKHLDRVQSALDGSIRPVFLQLDLTNKCNFSCEHCSSKMYPDYIQYCSAEQNTDRIFGLLNEAKFMDIKAIEITGGGEPTLYSSFVEIINEIRRKFEFALVTNGSKLMQREIRECLIGASWVRISIDAADAVMYEIVHGTKADGLLSSVLDAAEKFKTMSPSTVLGFSFIVTNVNYAQIVQAAELASRYGFDNIRFSSYYSPKGPMIQESNREKIFEWLQDAKELESEDFKVFTFAERVEDVYQEKKIGTCYYSSLVSVISAIGMVYPCCAMKNIPEHCIGDIYEDTLWNIYDTHEIITTKSCPPCWMDKKNNMLEYVLKPQLHANFP